MNRYELVEYKIKSQTKQCSSCKEVKDKNEFTKSKNKFDGLECYCKPCNKAKRQKYEEVNKEKLLIYKKEWRKNNYRRRKNLELEWNYGISLEKYEQILIKQEYSCAICKIHQDSLSRKLCVDHCHKTEQVRGLLCGNCNVGIGKLKDDINLLETAVNYLKSYKK